MKNFPCPNLVLAATYTIYYSDVTKSVMVCQIIGDSIVQ